MMLKEDKRKHTHTRTHAREWLQRKGLLSHVAGEQQQQEQKDSLLLLLLHR
jgi:hypothetical protein